MERILKATTTLLLVGVVVSTAMISEAQTPSNRRVIDHGKTTTVIISQPPIRPPRELLECSGEWTAYSHGAGTQQQLENAAIANWSAQVTNTYGAGYADWALANPKSMACVHGAGPGTYACTARGRVCRRP